MFQQIDLYTVYAIGFFVAAAGASLWSFVLDKQKPPEVGEFIAKLLARAVFLLIIFAVLMGFLSLAFGLFH